MKLIDMDRLLRESMFEFYQSSAAITPIGEEILSKFRKLIIRQKSVNAIALDMLYNITDYDTHIEQHDGETYFSISKRGEKDAEH